MTEAIEDIKNLPPEVWIISEEDAPAIPIILQEYYNEYTEEGGGFKP